MVINTFSFLLNPKVQKVIFAGVTTVAKKMINNMIEEEKEKARKKKG